MVSELALLEEEPPGIQPVDLPPAGFLDESTATRFDNVGYGVVPTTTGRFDFTFPTERQVSTSRLQSLTPAYLNLLGNWALEGIGGSCFADSGGPKFVHGTNTAVAIQSGGDARCRAHGYSQRLDVPDVRAAVDYGVAVIQASGSDYELRYGAGYTARLR